MALSAGKPVLEAAIVDAYMTAKTNGEEGKMTADMVIAKLAWCQGNMANTSDSAADQRVWMCAARRLQASPHA